MQVDRLNLLPKKLRKSIVDAHSVFLASWVVGFLLVISGFVYQNIQMKSRESQAQELATTVKTTDENLDAFTKKMQTRDEASRRVNQAKAFLAAKVTWTDALKELSLLMPKSVWLSNFSMKTNAEGDPYVELIGSASSQQKIAGFLESLEMSYYFHDVNLRKSEKVAGMEPDLYKFELEIEIPQLVSRGDP